MGEKHPLTGKPPEPKYPDGEYAQFTPEQDPRHRHFSHLYGVHPGQEITPEGTPALFAAWLQRARSVATSS